MAPTPSHPDAISKKGKKRFPTLDLARGAELRWDSYVNLRHVYKVDIANLRPYVNPDAPEVLDFRIEKESFNRLLSKSRFLTGYETENQLAAQDSETVPISVRSPEWVIPERDRSFSPPSSIRERSPTSETSSEFPLARSSFLGDSNDSRHSKDRQRSRMSWYETIYHYFDMVRGWPRTILKRLQIWLFFS